MKIQINAKALKAMTHIMAKRDIRYYLNGVLVEATATETVLVATDGHKMLAIRQTAENEVSSKAHLIIPGNIVPMMSSKNKLPKNIPFTIEEKDGASGIWISPLNNIGAKIEFCAVEGKFPDWRKVCGKAKPNGEQGQFNFKYLSDFFNAAKDHTGLSRPFMVLSSGGTNAESIISIDGDQDFIGVVMPMRTGDPLKEVPLWANDGLENVES